MEHIVREIVGTRGDLAVPVSRLATTANLFDAGLSSFGTVEVMLALEERFAVSFPDDLLTRANFASIAALCAVVETLRSTSPAG